MTGRRTILLGVPLSVLAGLAVVCQRRPPVEFPLLEAGMAVLNGSGVAAPLPAGTDVILRPGTRVPAGADSATLTRIGRADRAWLATGTVPGPPELQPMTERALLDLRSLTQPNGAVIAGWDPPWHYVWPRDAAFVAAAYTATGHVGDAARVLSYLASIAPADGEWQARYLADGSGDVPDGRGIQRDGAGWVLWAAACYAERSGGSAAALRELWPMLAASAQAIADSLDSHGLPPASADYWERPQQQLTLGVVAPCLAGLRAAVRLAERTGHRTERVRWHAAATRLAAGMLATFARTGYHRTVGGDFDAAVTFAGPPFLPASGPARRAVRRAYPRLRNPNGGERPGQNWRQGPAELVSWTPETALFALSFAATGQPVRADRILSWLAAHTTVVDSLPEKVAPDGQPASVAPLAWTCAIVLLASIELGPAANG